MHLLFRYPQHVELAPPKTLAPGNRGNRRQPATGGRAEHASKRQTLPMGQRRRAVGNRSCPTCRTGCFLLAGQITRVRSAGPGALVGLIWRGFIARHNLVRQGAASMACDRRPGVGIPPLPVCRPPHHRSRRSLYRRARLGRAGGRMLAQPLRGAMEFQDPARDIGVVARRIGSAPLRLAPRIHGD